MAEKKDADLFAESSEFTSTVFYTARIARAKVASAILKAYLLQDLSAPAPERIAEIRDDLANGRTRYQEEVQSLVAKYGAVASGGDLEKTKENIVAIAKEHIETTN